MRIEIDPMDAALLVEALTAVVLPPKKATRARNLIRYVQYIENQKRSER